MRDLRAKEKVEKTKKASQFGRMHVPKARQVTREIKYPFMDNGRYHNILRYVKKNCL